MNSTYASLLPNDFSTDSRVWVYQATRKLSQEESQKVKELLADFIHGWQSHGSPVKGFGALLFDQFLVLMADETAVGVSGCSTDSSVHFVQQIEKTLHLSFFDRQSLAFLVDGEVRIIHLTDLNRAFITKVISADTFYFNNLVQTKAELVEGWILPVKKTWLAGKIPDAQAEFRQ